MKLGFAPLLIFLTVAPATRADEKQHAKPAAVNPRPLVTISKETTVITEPLRDDGYPDYIRYLNEKLSRGVTPENNAVVPLFELMGLDEVDKESRDHHFNLLGVSPPPKNAAHFESWLNYVERLAVGDRPMPPAGYQRTAEEYILDIDEMSRKRPWTRREYPHLARWLSEQEPFIDKLVELTKRPRFYAPLVGILDSQSLLAANFATINPVRHASYALLTRAMFRAGKNDVTGALDDILAVRRLARLVATQPTQIDFMVGVACEGMAIDAQIALFAHVTFDREQLAETRKRESELPALSPAWENLDVGERLTFVETICAIGRVGLKGLKELSGGTFWKVTVESTISGQAFEALARANIDWDTPLRNGNKWYDRLVAVGKIQEPLKQRVAIDELDRDIALLVESVKKEMPAVAGGDFPQKFASEQLANTLIAIFAPALTSIYHAEDRIQTRQKLLHVAIALHEYCAEHRTFPAALNDLKGKYLETVPVDAHTASPFVYKRSENGYLLYSLGQNGRDDQGHGINLDNDADDLAIGVPVEM